MTLHADRLSDSSDRNVMVQAWTNAVHATGDPVAQLSGGRFLTDTVPQRFPPAPELSVVRWFNTPRPLTLADLGGRVVLLHAFQMLCPGCVAHGTPQAEKAHRLFAPAGLQVIGLHTVFEHHAAMTEVALEAFIHEYRLSFPIGVDRPGEEGPIPMTMQAYGMKGTPTAVLIGRDGRVRHHGFGVEEDMALGARIASALAAPALQS